MHKDKFVFAQLTQFLDRNHFNYLVKKYSGDKYIKSYTCWNQLLTMIFELDGHAYAFDSTTIDLCLSVFEWAKFRKHKGGIKLHTLYDIEAEVPAFVHITPANIHDSKAMLEIPYEPGAHYVFDRGYNDFSNLYTINRIGAFFVVRAKTNVRIKPKTWKRRLPEV